ncbi:MinD superfamily P-loop ATPase [Methanomicrobium sp. W14]|uniref:ATP-binding protein n=1 Tax=Methanomicrobium sp. W14 TaxID=2817839 RepID=UPI001AE582DB|nr:ATP-binding protein [Methanomicrobium sp. W14]MBP2132624.1 MinD superfamily P-loop ATPase [Methanomicrobium sp. W14]
MKSVAVVSGKGGTGKTTITAGFASLLAKERLTVADCDVDAANINLLFSAADDHKKDFFGSDASEIDCDKCICCGLCEENCRFDAISYNNSLDCFEVNGIKCEGCAVCTLVCENKAVSLSRKKTGNITVSSTGDFKIVHADLLPGCGSSGLLVKEVKKEAEDLSQNNGVILIDGPPGIGCPFIAAVSGVDYAVIVAEPGLSSLHDLKRAIEVIRNFGAEMFVIINRFDLNPDITKKIEDFCSDEKITVAGKIPYDLKVFSAIKNLKPVTYYNCPASEKIREVFSKISGITGLWGE